MATSLLEALSELPDPRLERGKKHRWSELLFIAVCTLLTGGESFYDMEDFASMRQEWLRRFLVLPGGPPSHDTFNRLFQMLDPAAFAETFARWTENLRGALPTGGREIVALNGKAARRAVNAGEDTRYLVSAWAAEQGLTLGQIQVADKSNEITAVPALLRTLELTGCVVTSDTLLCQKNTAKEIKEADADYVLALKGNQGVIHHEIKDALDDAIARADESGAKTALLMVTNDPFKLARRSPRFSTGCQATCSPRSAPLTRSSDSLGTTITVDLIVQQKVNVNAFLHSKYALNRGRRNLVDTSYPAGRSSVCQCGSLMGCT